MGIGSVGRQDEGGREVRGARAHVCRPTWLTQSLVGPALVVPGLRLTA